ncbi:MAG: ASCH domain-containing protein [Lacipirellulaceae bacterium]
MLLFKKKFLPAIRSGEKTQTIRLWKHRMMRSGQRSYIPGIGPIRIDTVGQVRLEELTDADAVPDGFKTAEALREELQTIYGEKLAAGYQAFRVTFHKVNEPDPT